MDTQVRLGKDSLVKDSIGECSGSVADDTATADEPVENSKDSQLKLVGSLGKGVVYLTSVQINKLLDEIGFDAFNRYVGRLADYIIEKNAHVKNHYETILKWYKEDSNA
jgi:thermostable 8-oxoguanine DNA glycosylase